MTPLDLLYTSRLPAAISNRPPRGAYPAVRTPGDFSQSLVETTFGRTAVSLPCRCEVRFISDAAVIPVAPSGRLHDSAFAPF